MEWFIRIGYAVMAGAIIVVFILSKRGEKELRFKVDRFAAAFLGLSNYVSPAPPRRKLAVRRSGSKVEPLPLQQQPEELRFILGRGRTGQTEELCREMESAAVDIKWHSRRNRRLREQFSEPVEKLYYLAHTFQSASLELNAIDDTNKENAFNSFLEDQLQHRMLLLRRISREFNAEFLGLNRKYDLESAERAEKEAKKNR